MSKYPELGSHLWDCFPNGVVSRRAHVITGSSAVYSASTRDGAILIHSSEAERPIAVYASDDAHHQAVGRRNIAEVIAITVEVPLSHVRPHTHCLASPRQTDSFVAI